MGKKGKMPDMNLPIWFDGQNINEALFCGVFGAFFGGDFAGSGARQYRLCFTHAVRCRNVVL